MAQPHMATHEADITRARGSAAAWRHVRYRLDTLYWSDASGGSNARDRLRKRTAWGTSCGDLLHRPGAAVPSGRSGVPQGFWGNGVDEASLHRSHPHRWRHPGVARRADGDRHVARHRDRPARLELKLSGVRLMPTDVVDPLASADPVTQPSLGPLGAGRWMWRQLTSMRTALVLLFLLALAAIPGSIFPQRGVSPIRVVQYLQDHSTTGPWFDRLSFFDVYASPWFAAIYLLLMVSLAGCILPRCWQYARHVRSVPPGAPRNLSRMPEHRTFITNESAADVLDSAGRVLRKSRFRLRPRSASDDAISAEKGYLHEVGNLIFHLSL